MDGGPIEIETKGYTPEPKGRTPLHAGNESVEPMEKKFSQRQLSPRREKNEYEKQQERNKELLSKRMGYKDIPKKKVLSQMSPEEREKEEQIEKLKHQNKRLRDDLKKINSELSDKLKRLTKKRAGVGEMDESAKQRHLDAVERELLNAKKQTELYTKELENIQSKNTNKGSVDRIYDLEAKLATFTTKNAKLKKDIFQMKKVESDQSKELGKMQDDGPMQIQVGAADSFQIRQMMAEVKKVNDKIVLVEEQLRKGERNKTSEIEHTKKLEQELAQLEPKYGKHVQSVRNIRLNHKSHNTTPPPRPGAVSKQQQHSESKDEATIKKEKAFQQMRHEHEKEKDQIEIEMQLLEAEVAKLKDSLSEKQQEGRLSKVKMSELQRQVKFHSLVPISPAKLESKQTRDIDDQIKTIKRLKDRKESVSIGPKKRSGKLRDHSALPALSRQDDIVDMRKSKDLKRSFSRKSDASSVKEIPLGDQDLNLHSKASEKMFAQGHLGSKDDPIPQPLTKA